MTLTRHIALSALLIAAGALAGCKSESSEPVGPTRTITDDLGRDVEVPARPQRIAAVSPFAVEMLMALGHRPILRPEMGGDPARPPEAADIDTISVNHGAGPNVEQLVAARPDLAILQPTYRSSIEAITAQGVPAVVYDIASISDVPRTLEAIGDLVDEKEKAAGLAGRVRADLAAARADLPAGKRPVVFAMFGTTQSFYTFLPDSYLGSMITHLGGEVMAPAEGDPLPFAPTLAPFSIEDVIASQPDLVLIVRHGGGEPADTLAELPGWEKLKAVQSGRVHFIDEATYLLNPGPGVVEGVRRLRDLMYPAANNHDEVAASE